MTARPLKDIDLPELQQIEAESGFPYAYPFGPKIEAAQVVVDEEGDLIVAAVAERIPQIYLWCRKGGSPAAKLAALRLLHGSMATELKKKGYNSADGFIPPVIAQRFGRRLERTFRWVKNWPSWAVNF